MTLDEFLAARPLFQVRFWADNAPLGEIQFAAEPFGQSLSEFFYCHVCDQVWGMIEYPNRHWIPQHLTCREHSDERSEYFIPGSMLDALANDDEISRYPAAFIRREFEVHLANAEKELENESIKATDIP